MDMAGESIKRFMWIAAKIILALAAILFLIRFRFCMPFVTDNEYFIKSETFDSGLTVQVICSSDCETFSAWFTEKVSIHRFIVPSKTYLCGCCSEGRIDIGKLILLHDYNLEYYMEYLRSRNVSAEEMQKYREEYMATEELVEEYGDQAMFIY